MGIVAALLFFGSLLLHELGHAVQARARGRGDRGDHALALRRSGPVPGRVPERGRGVPDRDRRAARDGRDRLALRRDRAGDHLPDASTAWSCGSATSTSSCSSSTSLPALPLDGGRVLRSALWAARRDFCWATRMAADVARMFAFLLIAGGIVLLIVQGAF